jgi:hypothetical protein
MVFGLFCYAETHLSINQSTAGPAGMDGSSVNLTEPVVVIMACQAAATEPPRADRVELVLQCCQGGAQCEGVDFQQTKRTSCLA